MLTTSPHLHARRPSPTTIEYTVSTTPTLTLPLRLLLLATLLLRLLLGLSTLLLLYSKWSLSAHFTAGTSSASHPPSFFSNDFIWYTIDTIHASALGRLFTAFAAHIPVPVLLPASALVMYGIAQRIYTCESLLVLRGLGIQTSTSSATYLGTASTRFIPTEKIQDILVNEAFRGFEVRYYLVVIVENEDEVVVVFPKLLPGRNIVEKVWRGARGCLYEPEKMERVEKEGDPGR